MYISKEGQNVIVLRDFEHFSFYFAFMFLALAAYMIFFIETGDKIINIIYGANFAIIGFAILLTAKIITIRLDRGKGRCSFSIWKISGAKKIECSVSEIKKVQLERVARTPIYLGKENPYYRYLLTFFLQDGRELRFEFGKIPPEKTTDFFGISASEKKTKAAREIAEFLGVPFNEVSFSAKDTSSQAEKSAQSIEQKK